MTQAKNLHYDHELHIQQMLAVQISGKSLAIVAGSAAAGCSHGNFCSPVNSTVALRTWHTAETSAISRASNSENYSHHQQCCLSKDGLGLDPL